MYLNTIKPACGAKTAKVRVGRGIGCGKGKTCGRGHKGQKARSGYSAKTGFEGGQMPLQRRLPKFGFTSRSAAVAEVRLGSLSRLTDMDANVEVSLTTLKAVGLIKKTAEAAKIILSGTINKPVSVVGVMVTGGARKAIEAAGGSIKD